MSLTGQEQFTKYFFLGELAADSSGIKSPLMTVPSGYTLQLKGAKIGADTAITAQASNYQDIQVKTVGGTCLAWFSNNSSGGGTITAGDFSDMTTIKTLIPASTTIQVTYVQANSGQAYSGAVIQLDLEPYLA